MTEPDRSPPGDELTQRYREASAKDTRRPGAHVRDAVRAHAQMVITAGKASEATDNGHKAPAANQSRWKISALAGLALAGLTGLMVLQFDRGTDEEKDIAFGQPSASAPPAAVPAPAPAPAAAPVTVAPPTPQADSRNARAKPVDSAPPALKAPAKPAAEKPAPQPSATGTVAPKAEAEAAARSLKSASPLPAAPPPPAPAPAPAQESAQAAQSAQLTDAATGGQGVLSAAPRQAAAPVAAAAAQPSAPTAAPAPAMAAPAPAATAAQEQKREKFSAPTPPSLPEAPSNLRLAGALQNAARAGNLPQLERLLQQGAALNAADAAGRTPLILAAMQGHTAVVQHLLAAGANTALIDNDGLNALQHARRQGFDGIAHLIETAR